jgi:hypothetical protein
LSPADAQGMIGLGTDLYVDFGGASTGGYGFYLYNGLWTRLSPSDAGALATYANKLVADFPGIGLYEYDGTWKRISPNNCEGMIAVDLY